IEAAHRAGIIHRDLKPANVMLDRAGAGANAKVLDFGIAKLVDEAADAFAATGGGEASATPSLTASGAIFGTPLYMSPEQATGEAVDARTDVWSLGVVLYELITGVTPFDRKTAPATFTAILRDAPRPLAGVPDALADLVARMLAKDPNARVGSAREVATQL